VNRIYGINYIFAKYDTLDLFKAIPLVIIHKYTFVYCALILLLMIYSMTGYAIQSQEIFEDTITIEVRALNSKFFDFSIKCPDYLLSLEEQIKKITKKNLKRGKIEIRIKRSKSDHIKDDFNLDELKEKMSHLKKISPKSTKEKLLELALLMPKKSQKKPKQITKKYQSQFFKFLQKVVEDLIIFRKKEGQALKKELVKYINQVSTQLVRIKKIDKKRITSKKQKIKMRFDSAFQKYNQTRLEEEMIYYIEKLDISEEITRLSHHNTYFLELLSSDEEVGKKINFLTQEMLRETNTIGSKSNNFQLQKSVVAIKDKLEKIKEQIQNVL
tara:strand:- start:1587 stop:2570 length:984 start_codon:yes stop_codon:yes gene_type:complete